MARGLADGLLRLCNGVWKDLDGDSVDIVEVIRCKDCKHCDVYQSILASTTSLICMIHSFELVEPTNYCSKGERKVND